MKNCFFRYGFLRDIKAPKLTGKQLLEMQISDFGQLFGVRTAPVKLLIHCLERPTHGKNPDLIDIERN